MATELEAAFEEAAQLVSSGRVGNVVQEQQLELYGLYSVVKKGAAPNQGPSAFLDPAGFAKWTAWQASSHLEREEAMREYAELVSKLRSAPTSKSSGSKQGSGLGNKVSAGFDISPESDRSCTEQFDICYWAALGNIEAVHKCLNRGVSPDYKDEDGLTPLMRAVDRNEFKVVDVLIDAGADLNATDKDGQTALHYAVCCDHSEMVGLLLSHGARTDIIDVHGDGALSPASDGIKEIVNQVKQGKWRRTTKQCNRSRWCFTTCVPNMQSVSNQLLLGSVFIGLVAIVYYRFRK